MLEVDEERLSESLIQVSPTYRLTPLGVRMCVHMHVDVCELWAHVCLYVCVCARQL